MDEAEWLNCTDPEAMLELLRHEASGRKLQLFGSACHLRIPAEAAVRWEQLRRGGHISGVTGRPGFRSRERKDVGRAMMEAENAVAIVTCGAPRQADKRALAAAERAAQCTLLRDIFGNPFHPITLNLSWLTPTVLAQDVYDHRSFDRLPELAQALQDAGCEDAELLAHLRGPGPHVKGCHALDLLLAKQ